MVTKVNPVYADTIPRSFVGKSVSEFTIAITPDITGSDGPEGAIDAVLKTATLRATPVMISDVTASGVTIYLEGEFPDSDYDGDGSDETFAAVMQADLQALGTVDSQDLSATTVTAGTVFQADQTNA